MTMRGTPMPDPNLAPNVDPVADPGAAPDTPAVDPIPPDRKSVV